MLPLRVSIKIPLHRKKRIIKSQEIPFPRQDLHLVVLLHPCPRLGDLCVLGLALHLIPRNPGHSEQRENMTPKSVSRATCPTDMFIPGAHREQDEEAELLGWQQWLLLQEHPPAITGGWGELTGCLQRTGHCPLPSWSHPVNPGEGEGNGGAQTSARMLALGSICTGQRSPREEESVTA